MCTAESGLLDILGAAWVSAVLSFGTVRNTKTTLDYAIEASFDVALAADSLAGAPGSKLTRPIIFNLVCSGYLM